MKLFGIWTVLVALVISVVAAYYSIVGLVAIFAAAVIPIVIMGAALEVGKLTTAVWLHTYWDKAAWHIKSYLVIALVLLMFITSMGIFGFLSKAHIEQTAQSTEGIAQLERIESQVARLEDINRRSEEKIVKLENTNSNADTETEAKIQNEQQRIDTAYDRIQPAIDEQKELLSANLVPYEETIANIDSQLELYNTYNKEGSIKDIQRLVGTTPDGAYGPGTRAAVDEWLTKQEITRGDTVNTIQSLRTASTEEIQRIRGIAEKEIADSNKLIARLRDQLGRNDNQATIDSEIAELRDSIKNNVSEIDGLFEQKYSIEGEIRKLEAEVGPVKYIADMVYGETADHNTLEAAVRWVIIILVIVFDPLAVVLIIAGITLIEDARSRRKKPDPQVEELSDEIHDVEDEIVELREELDETIKELAQVEIEMAELQAEDEVVLPEVKTEENTTPIVEETQMPPLDAYNDDRLATKHDMETDWSNNDVQTLADEELKIIEAEEEVEKSEEVVYTDSKGEYTVDKITGVKRYKFDQGQYDLNERSKKQKQVDATIQRMKQDGFWPSIGLSKDVEEMIRQADQDTLDEVYQEITKDLNQKKEI